MYDCSRRNGHWAILRRRAVLSPFPFLWANRIPLSLSRTIASLFAFAFSTIMVATLWRACFTRSFSLLEDAKFLLHAPVMGMPLVEPGAPDPVKGVEASTFGEVVRRPVAPNDGLLVEVIANL